MSENNMLSEANVNENSNIIDISAETSDVQTQLCAPEYVLADESRVDCRGAELEFPVEKALFYRLVLFIISAVLLAFSFLPFFYIKADVGRAQDARISFNSVDSVKILVSSLQNVRKQKLMEKDSFEELSPYYNKDSGEFSFIGVEGIILGSTVKKATLFNLKSSKYTVCAGYALAAVASIGYFVVSLIFFVLSTISLLLEYYRNKHGKHDTDRLFKASTVLLWSVFALLPLVGFCFSKLCCLAPGVMPVNAISNRGLGFGFFASLAVAGVFSVIAFVKQFRNLKRKQKGKINYKTKRGLACCILAVALIASLFLPAVTIRFYDENSVRQVAISTSAKGIQELTSDDIETYLKVSRVDSYNSLFELRNKAMKRVDHRDSFFNHSYKTLIIGYRRADVSSLHLAILFISAFMIFSASMTLMYSLRDILFNSVSAKKMNFFKFLSFIAAVANSVFIIIIQQYASGTVVGNLSGVLSVGLGIAPIVMILCGALIIFSIKKPKKLLVIDKEFDNPDVSYAPYVLSDKQFNKK